MNVNKENVRKWVDALRSGKYEQGKNNLRTIQRDGATSYCCLGVACDLADASLWRGDNTHGTAGLGVLSTEACEWLGVSTRNLDVGEDGIVRSLSGWNDSGTSFPTIADMIEAKYLTEQVSA